VTFDRPHSMDKDREAVVKLHDIIIAQRKREQLLLSVLVAQTNVPVMLLCTVGHYSASQSCPSKLQVTIILSVFKISILYASTRQAGSQMGSQDAHKHQHSQQMVV